MPELQQMSPTVRTANIPFLALTRPSGDPVGIDSSVLHAGEDELAKLSHATLQRLRSRIRQVAGQTVADKPTLTPNAAEPSPDVQAVPQAAAFAPKQAERKDNVKVAIDQLVEIVCERSSSAAPTLLLFVGSEPNEHVDETCARVASALCEHTNSRVLLIDSDSDTRNLTTAAKQTGQVGITEVIERNHNWQDTLLRNGNGNLDFMPCGDGQFGRWNQKELMRKAVVQMKAEYQFICVAGGDAHSRAAKVWSDVCDGSYLLVSVKKSNGTVAKSAVAELQSGGARLLGCIVTDVDQ